MLCFGINLFTGAGEISGEVEATAITVPANAAVMPQRTLNFDKIPTNHSAPTYIVSVQTNNMQNQKKIMPVFIEISIADSKFLLI